MYSFNANRKFLLGRLTARQLKQATVRIGEKYYFYFRRTKYPFFLCEWDSCVKDKHFSEKLWPRRTLKFGKNTLKSCVQFQTMLLSLHYIKLGIMKQFAKALPEDGYTFKYQTSKIPRLFGNESKRKRFYRSWHKTSRA